MIFISFTEPTTQDWVDWKSECREATATLIDNVRNGASPTITNLYKDDRLKRVYVSEDQPFYGKCAYCETRIIGSQPGDIEHFRPKSRVTDDDNVPVRITSDDGVSHEHPGYYWLAYESHNLLYACADCNRPSSFKTTKQVGKWDKFPVREFRASQ